MIIYSNNLKEQLDSYSNINNKISREIQNGKLISLKNGLYETDPNVPGHYLACAIYGPSYLSFDFALSYYGLIPEKVVNYTSATYNKKKKKEYTNHYGTFIYRDVPSDVYPIGIKIIEENGYVYHIATSEKAICDKVYTMSPVNNNDELEELLYNNLRIYKDELFKLDISLIEQIESLYHSTNVTMLYRYIRRSV